MTGTKVCQINLFTSDLLFFTYQFIDLLIYVAYFKTYLMGSKHNLEVIADSFHFYATPFHLVFSYFLSSLNMIGARSLLTDYARLFTSGWKGWRRQRRWTRYAWRLPSRFGLCWNIWPTERQRDHERVLSFAL